MKYGRFPEKIVPHRRHSMLVTHTFDENREAAESGWEIINRQSGCLLPHDLRGSLLCLSELQGIDPRKYPYPAG